MRRASKIKESGLRKKVLKGNKTAAANSKSLKENHSKKSGQWISIGKFNKLQASLRATNERVGVAREAADKASGAGDAFMAARSHELRIPLNPVLLLASQAIEDRELPP